MVRKIYFLFIMNILQLQKLVLFHGNLGVKAFQEEMKTIYPSYNKFQEYMNTFFKFPFDKIEKHRQKLKNALNTFWKELHKSDSSTIAKTKYRVDNTNMTFREITLRSYKYLNTAELVRLHGFRVEPHTVITRDGYRLTIFRISEVNNVQTAPKIALFHHGLLGSSSDWLLLGPKKALPYMLVKSGYEVWLANARGNLYSKRHNKLNIDSKEFWNFTWHELGTYDLPSIIDYIRIVTGDNSKIDFIGHSMGATALLVLLSNLPRYNNVLKSAVLMAPLAIMRNVRGPLKLLAAFIYKYGSYSLSFFGDKLFQSKGVTFPRSIIDKYCIGDTILCSNPWLLMANGGIDVNPHIKADIMSHVPSGTSMKTMIHYAQILISGKFREFCKEPHNSISPPEYSLNNVQVPVTLFSTLNDWLAPSGDVAVLMKNIPTCMTHFIVERDNFTHTDFVWSNDVQTLVYDTVMSILNN